VNRPLRRSRTQSQNDLANLTSAREEAKESILWGLAEFLSDQLQEVAEHLEDLSAQMADAKEKSRDGDAIEAEGKKTKKNALRRLLIKLAVLIGLGVAVAFGVIGLAIGGIVLIVSASILAILWVIGLVRSAWRCAYTWFRADLHMNWLRIGRLQVLERAIRIEDAQLRRFKYLVHAEKEWADLIATICYFPFRRPTVDRIRRTREPDLGLPSSHQVVEAYTTEPRFDGITASVASELIRPGWLSVTYHSALEYSVEEHDLRTRGGNFEPDEDVTTQGDQIGPRRTLVEATVSGRARQRREIEVLRRIHESIRTGAGFRQDPLDAEKVIVDRLFTPWNGVPSPSGFLSESILGEPSNFNREFIPFQSVPTRHASEMEQVAVLPDPPTIEEMIEGATTEFPPLVFSSWSIEAADEVAIDELTFFAETPTPVQLDLSIAATRWTPPPNECAGTISVRPPEERSSWVLDLGELPSNGSTIRPRPGSRPDSGRGPYRFMIEQDGEPLSHSRSEPVKYALRADCAAPGAVDMVLRALQCVADRSGNEFVFDGTFEGLPTSSSDRIEIGWAFDEEFRKWEHKSGKDSVAGRIGWGGPGAVLGNALAKTVLGGGFVLLNAEMSYQVGFLPGPSHGMVLLHELGHVMNLDHVADDREIMCTGNAPEQLELDYGPGDALGLRTLEVTSSRA
jgi:hypothetical protein